MWNKGILQWVQEKKNRVSQNGVFDYTCSPKRQVQGAQQTVGQHVVGKILTYAFFDCRKGTILKRIIPTPQKIYNGPSSYLLRPIKCFSRPGSVILFTTWPGQQGSRPK